MNFWDIKHPINNIALIQANNNKVITYSQLQTAINNLAVNITNNHKSLGFVFCQNTISSISGYLAALQSNQAVCLLGADLHYSLAQNLIDRYQPAWIWMPQKNQRFAGFQDSFLDDSYVLQKRILPGSETAIYPELAVLLSTSGSTGSPKLVRLSYKNIQANADSIAEYLELSANEKPITTLPMHYSYGLSVINSHLHMGATILLTDDAVITQSFWDFFKQYGATSLAGVPYTYQMLHRLQIDTMNLPSLKTMTQAGGRLDIKLQQHFANYAKQQNIRFFVMYGQTEATARMSYVPPNRLADSLGSIGIAIPNGRFEIDPTSEELIYYGPNVMLGYAESREDLALGNTQLGKLATGDIAHQDPSTGFFSITGRKKRFLKLVGLRINLDEVEQKLEQHCQANCYCIGKDDKLIIILSDIALVPQVNTILTQDFRIHPSLFSVKIATEVPHLPTGKTDYTELQKRFLE